MKSKDKVGGEGLKKYGRNEWKMKIKVWFKSLKKSTGQRKPKKFKSLRIGCRT